MNNLFGSYAFIWPFFLAGITNGFPISTSWTYLIVLTNKYSHCQINVHLRQPIEICIVSASLLAAFFFYYATFICSGYVVLGSIDLIKLAMIQQGSSLRRYYLFYKRVFFSISLLLTSTISLLHFFSYYWKCHYSRVFFYSSRFCSLLIL